ncbi:MAG: glycosyltransferase family 2 protein [Candidatus Omnitrophica bacterium]|nr:glycosyltransferase family 2 protein [Candidatus Omnitrophota bacterium]
MRLSLVIPTMNRSEDLSCLLRSVAAQTRPPDEVVIVDQSDNVKTKAVVDDFIKLGKAEATKVVYFFTEEKSLVSARNRGVEKSTGDVISFSDDDVIFYSDYFERILFYLQDKTIGGISGNVVVKERASGFKWQVRKMLMTFFLVSNYRGGLTFSTFGYPIHEREICETTAVQLLPGCSMCFRRELLLKNTSDTWFKGYGYREDVDLSYRISRQAKLIMVADARYIHNQSPVNRLNRFRLKKMEFDVYQYLAKKYIGENLFRWILFYYSLTGLFIIDLLENLSGTVTGRKGGL